MALFVQMDVNWVDNDKVIAVGLEGAGLHAAALCMAKRLETDGVLTRAQLRRVGANDALIDLLVDEQLFDVVDDRRVRVHGWLDHNPSREAIARGSREGNHKRWGHPGPVDTCPKCNPVDKPPVRATEQTRRSVPVDPPGIPPGSVGDRPPNPPVVLETETYPESETEQAAEREPRGLPTDQAPAAAAGDQPGVGDVFDAALDVLTGRELDRNPTRGGNPQAHAKAVRNGKRRDHAPDAHRLLYLNPSLTAVALADLLEPPPDTGPTNGTHVPGLRVDVRSEAATVALLDEQRALGPPDDEQLAAAAAFAAAARQRLRTAGGAA